MRAIWQLQWWQSRNRLRKLLRSPGWLIFYAVMGVGFVTLVVYSARTSISHPPAAGATMGRLPFTLPVAISLWAVVATLMAVQQGTKRPPVTFELGDVNLLLPTPLPPRLVFAAQFLRRLLGHLLQALPSLVWVGYLLIRVSYRIPLGGLVGLFLSFFLIQVWADAVESVVWMALYRQQPERAAARAGWVRNAVLVITIVALAWALTPLLPSVENPAAPRLTALSERLDTIAAIPPFGWFGELVPATPGPVSSGSGGLAASRPAAALALVGLIVAASGLAVFLANEYYEPALAQTEVQRQVLAAARGQSGTAATTTMDTQGTALAILGGRATDRLASIQVQPFGQGAWAIAWEQLLRYLRFERATIVYALAFVALFGGVLGAIVRGAGLPPAWAWSIPLLLSLLNLSTGYLGEEFRRPEIYLIPDPTIVRLLAASLVSWWDTSSTGSLMLWLAALVASAGTPTFGSVMAGTLAAWVLLLTLTWLTLGAGLLSMILVPPWLPGMTRVLLSFLILLPALIPSLAVCLIVAWQLGSIPAGFLAAALPTALLAAILFAVAARFFDRLEVTD
ncbi:MAG: hypothetical protein IMX01_08990 [Limnochordaceae bacterium]|nr:hypothetical protein [Limnochordaceae bacterium]